MCEETSHISFSCTAKKASGFPVAGDPNPTLTDNVNSAAPVIGPTRETDWSEQTLVWVLSHIPPSKSTPSAEKNKKKIACSW